MNEELLVLDLICVNILSFALQVQKTYNCFSNFIGQMENYTNVKLSTCSFYQ